MKRSERQRQLGLWITGLWAVAGCGGGQIGEAEPKAPDAISDSIVTRRGCRLHKALAPSTRNICVVRPSINGP